MQIESSHDKHDNKLKVLVEKSFEKQNSTMIVEKATKNGKKILPR
jgi:hypothetical protein